MTAEEHLKEGQRVLAIADELGVSERSGGAALATRAAVHFQAYQALTFATMVETVTLAVQEVVRRAETELSTGSDITRAG